MTMADQDSQPVNQRELTTRLYHTALVRAFLFQVFFVVLASLILDGGIVARAFTGLSIGYWVSAVVVLLLQPRGWGLLYLRHGVWIVFVSVLVICSIWREKVVDLVGGR
jgi:hypothetical protein